MSIFLTQVTETYRADTEDEAQQLIKEAKEGTGEVTKYSYTHKEIKAKGEVIDDYYKITITKNFNNEKEPEQQININYEVL